MSSTKPPAQGSDSFDGHSHFKHQAFKGHKGGKKSASVQNGEEAPLLVEDTPDGDIEANGTATPAAPPSKTKSFRGRLQHAWHWVLKNLIVVAVACLLVAGIVALCVYFGGESGSFCVRFLD